MELKGINPYQSFPVTVNGKVVGHTEGSDIVITDEAAAALLRGNGRLHVSIGLLDTPPVVSDLPVRAKAIRGGLPWRTINGGRG